MSARGETLFPSLMIGSPDQIFMSQSPGSGKTLTAESVAEHLQRPLYVVSSGELGMTAETVAKGLREALDLCESWNAVALIDEVRSRKVHAAVLLADSLCRRTCTSKSGVSSSPR